MKLNLFVFPILLALGCSCQTVGRRPVADLARSVVLVEVEQRGRLAIDVDGGQLAVGPILSRNFSGTGFVVDQKREIKSEVQDGGMVIVTKTVSLVATNDHVTEPPEDGDLGDFTVKFLEPKFRVSSWSGEECPATLVWASGVRGTHDVAFLRVECDLGPPVEIDARTPPVGAWVTAIGVPRAFHPDGVFSLLDGRMQGLCDNPADEEQDGLMISTSVPITGGSSGSPLFYEGRVVGIMSMAMEFPHISFAVRAREIIIDLNSFVSKESW